VGAWTQAVCGTLGIKRADVVPLVVWIARCTFPPNRPLRSQTNCAASHTSGRPFGIPSKSVSDRIPRLVSTARLSVLQLGSLVAASAVQANGKGQPQGGRIRRSRGRPRDVDGAVTSQHHKVPSGCSAWR
jgi:hypothetical protein